MAEEELARRRPEGAEEHNTHRDIQRQWAGSTVCPDGPHVLPRATSLFRGTCGGTAETQTESEKEEKRKAML